MFLLEHSWEVKNPRHIYVPGIGDLVVRRQMDNGQLIGRRADGTWWLLSLDLSMSDFLEEKSDAS